MRGTTILATTALSLILVTALVLAGAGQLASSSGADTDTLAPAEAADAPPPDDGAAPNVPVEREERRIGEMGYMMGPVASNIDPVIRSFVGFGLNVAEGTGDLRVVLTFDVAASSGVRVWCPDDTVILVGEVVTPVTTETEVTCPPPPAGEQLVRLQQTTGTLSGTMTVFADVPVDPAA